MKKMVYIVLIAVILIVVLMVQNKNNITYAVGDTLADTVIAQSKGTTWSSGASGVYNTTYSNGGSDYRYIGVDIDNYVNFNDDLYRIIGVFDENTHGKSSQNLVKLIRARFLASNGWGVVNDAIKGGSYSSYKNDWTGKQYTTPASLNILLNEYFYNKISTSDTYGECSNWTYFADTAEGKTGNCKMITGKGIAESVRNYIETVTWHLYGFNSNELTPSNFYLCERGLYSGCTSANSGAADTSTEAPIGLMYPSDYLYASGYNASTSTLTGDSYYMGNQNWMFMGYEWLITPVSNDDESAYHVLYGSSLYDYNSYIAYGIRPTFYLKEDVYVTGGNGTIDNPYTLACDTCSSS